MDRKQTYLKLLNFLDKRDDTLAEEIAWIESNGIDVILSDATFLGWYVAQHKLKQSILIPSLFSAAAKGAHKPSILVTNFTFDAIYSFLSFPPLTTDDEPAISEDLLAPLVQRCVRDYACADLLLRLPGAIPIPAFNLGLPMPVGKWVKKDRTDLTDEIKLTLTETACTRIVDVPLMIRPLSPDVHTPAFRLSLLKQLGVPPANYSSKILLVSFGGQAIPMPTSTARSSNGVPVNSKNGSGLLPPGWIAIVCGMKANATLRDNLPFNFFAVDVDVFVPDVTAVADVVLGKLVRNYHILISLTLTLTLLRSAHLSHSH